MASFTTPTKKSRASMPVPIKSRPPSSTTSASSSSSSTKSPYAPAKTRLSLPIPPESRVSMINADPSSSIIPRKRPAADDARDTLAQFTSSAQQALNELHTRLRKVEAQRDSLQTFGRTREARLTALEEDRAALEERVRELERGGGGMGSSGEVQAEWVRAAEAEEAARVAGQAWQRAQDELREERRARTVAEARVAALEETLKRAFESAFPGGMGAVNHPTPSTIPEQLSPSRSLTPAHAESPRPARVPPPPPLVTKTPVEPDAPARTYTSHSPAPQALTPTPASVPAPAPSLVPVKPARSKPSTPVPEIPLETFSFLIAKHLDHAHDAAKALVRKGCDYLADEVLEALADAGQPAQLSTLLTRAIFSRILYTFKSSVHNNKPAQPFEYAMHLFDNYFAKEPNTLKQIKEKRNRIEFNHQTTIKAMMQNPDGFDFAVKAAHGRRGRGGRTST